MNHQKKFFFLPLLALLLFSCRENYNQAFEPEEAGYKALACLKNDQKDDFYSLCAQERAFRDLPDLVNNAVIRSVQKIEVKSMQTRDLKSVSYSFAYHGEKRSLYLLNNNLPEKSLVLEDFFVLHAAYRYEIDNVSSEKIIKAISRLCDAVLAKK